MRSEEWPNACPLNVGYPFPFVLITQVLAVTFEHSRCDGHKRRVVRCYCSVREMLAVLQPDPGRPTSLTRKLNKGPYFRIDAVQKDGSASASLGADAVN
jgi:hypothetical protein